LFACITSSNTAFAEFRDVHVTNPNYEGIAYAQSLGIVEGYADGAFRPEASINRAEFTKIITEAYYPGQANGSDCFPDVKTEWFAKYICFSKDIHFISGYPDGSFKPANEINFVESAKILANAQGFEITPDPDFWFKPYVEKLAQANAIPTSIKSFSQNITRGEMAEMVYRLRANATQKPSTSYEELVTEQESIGLPVRIRIPSINVNAVIETVGLTPDGFMDVPKDPFSVAWYNLGPRPGDTGSAVLSGHVNWYNLPKAVFADLKKLLPGDEITIEDDKGAVITFIVRESRLFIAAADATEVFTSYDGGAHLNLVTCQGVWNRSEKQYDQRLVIFADKE
jgi:sortase (surface protein transpeptidase)